MYQLFVSSLSAKLLVFMLSNFFKKKNQFYLKLKKLKVFKFVEIMSKSSFTLRK